MLLFSLENTLGLLLESNLEEDLLLHHLSLPLVLFQYNHQLLEEELQLVEVVCQGLLHLQLEVLEAQEEEVPKDLQLVIVLTSMLLM